MSEVPDYLPEDFGAPGKLEGTVDGEPVVPLSGDDIPFPFTQVFRRGEKIELEIPRIQIPPLRRPEVEMLTDGVRSTSPEGKVSERYVAVLSSRTVRCGPVRIQLRDLQAEGDTRQEATTKLGQLVGCAVAQVYVKLITSDDPAEVDHGRAMEIGSGELGS